MLESADLGIFEISCFSRTCIPSLLVFMPVKESRVCAVPLIKNQGQCAVKGDYRTVIYLFSPR